MPKILKNTYLHRAKNPKELSSTLASLLSMVPNYVNSIKVSYPEVIPFNLRLSFGLFFLCHVSEYNESDHCEFMFHSYFPETQTWMRLPNTLSFHFLNFFFKFIDFTKVSILFVGKHKFPSLKVKFSQNGKVCGKKKSLHHFAFNNFHGINFGTFDKINRSLKVSSHLVLGGLVVSPLTPS